VAAAIEFLAAAHTRVCVVTRLRVVAIRTVPRKVWRNQISFMSGPRRDTIEIPRSHIWRGMENALARAEPTASATINGFKVMCPIRKRRYLMLEGSRADGKSAFCEAPTPPCSLIGIVGRGIRQSC
jgi:hypothetical protein